jgi:hypothetical protein
LESEERKYLLIHNLKVQAQRHRCHSCTTFFFCLFISASPSEVLILKIIFHMAIYSNGDRYEGEFASKIFNLLILLRTQSSISHHLIDNLDGKREGRGTLVSSNGDVYEGDFKNEKELARSLTHPEVVTKENTKTT